MIYALIASAVSNMLLIGVLYATIRSATRERADRASAYEKTLQTMADRVQAPERLPVREVSELVVPLREPDEWASVGQVSIADNYGMDD